MATAAAARWQGRQGQRQAAGGAIREAAAAEEEPEQGAAARRRGGGAGRGAADRRDGAGGQQGRGGLAPPASQPWACGPYPSAEPAWAPWGCAIGLFTVVPSGGATRAGCALLVSFPPPHIYLPLEREDHLPSVFYSKDDIGCQRRAFTAATRLWQKHLPFGTRVNDPQQKPPFANRFGREFVKGTYRTFWKRWRRC